MKTQYIMSAVLVAMPMIFGQANAGEKELNKSQVPKAVIAAFEKAYPNAKGLEFEEEVFEGKAAYEVEYKGNGKEYELLYSADGALLQKEEEIDGKSLPEPVAQAIKKAYPKAEIKEVEKLMKPDSTVTGYEVEIKSAGKEIELELDISGNILKTDKEQD
jgi:uncharacterized membrane protein YkoI